MTVDMRGLTPDQSWSGKPDDNIVRHTYLYDVDSSLSDPSYTVSSENANTGFNLLEGPYVSETAANWEYTPCFKSS